MKKLFLLSGTLLILLNSVLGMLISSYHIYNWLANNFILLFNTALVYKIANSMMADGFKLSFSLLVPIIGVIQLILVAYMSNNFLNNSNLIIVISLVFLEILLLILGKLFSKLSS